MSLIIVKKKIPLAAVLGCCPGYQCAGRHWYQEGHMAFCRTRWERLFCKATRHLVLGCPSELFSFSSLQVGADPRAPYCCSGPLHFVFCLSGTSSSWDNLGGLLPPFRSLSEIPTALSVCRGYVHPAPVFSWLCFIFLHSTHHCLPLYGMFICCLGPLLLSAVCAMVLARHIIGAQDCWVVMGAVAK